MKKENDWLAKFPKVPEKLMREARKIHRAFILYNHQKRAYCTHCEREYTLDVMPSHKQKFFCPKCRLPGQAIDVTKNYNGEKVADIANATIYLAGKDGNLYVRCFSQRIGFKHGELRPVRSVWETQRYVFTPKKVVRYGVKDEWYNDGNKWYKYCGGGFVMNARFNYPNFHDTGLLYYRVYHKYGELNRDEAIAKTWLKHCAVEELELGDDSALGYLNFYSRHTGAERLIKCGFASDVKTMIHNSAFAKKINWKETEVPKMLGINRAEFNCIRDNGFNLEYVCKVKRVFPTLPIDKGIELFRRIRGYDRYIERVYEIIGEQNLIKAVKYLEKQVLNIELYKDYLENACELGADMASEEILFPPHLMNAHDRAYEAVRAKEIEAALKAEKAAAKKAGKLKKARKTLEFEYGGFIIRQPKDVEEIVHEGAALLHCVAGYARSHFAGETTIMFIRKKDEPNVPYFTVEVHDCQIVQCHGYRNERENKKPRDIIELEKAYGEYLESLKSKKQMKIGA